MSDIIKKPVVENDNTKKTVNSDADPSASPVVKKMNTLIQEAAPLDDSDEDGYGNGRG